MNDYVVVFRMDNDVDHIGVLVGEDDQIIKIEHPHTATVSMITGHVVMMPYCSLTDETFFVFPRDKMKFLVTATDHVANHYLKLIASRSLKKESLESKPIVDDPSDDVLFVDGNETKH